MRTLSTNHLFPRHGCHLSAWWLRLAAMVIQGIIALTAQASTITWTNTSGGLWSGPNNWDPHIVPRSFDAAVITAAGTYTVTVDTNVNVTTLTLGGSGQQMLTNNAQNISISGSAVVNANGILGFGGGILSGGPMTVQGTFNFGGGYTELPITIGAVGGMMNILGAVNLAGPLTNSGTVNLSSGALYVLNNAGIYTGTVQNQAGGLFNVQGNLPIVCGCYGFEFFKNSGTFRKTSGVGTASVGLVFTNLGTVDAQNGTIAFAGGGNVAGTYNTAAGATIEFDGGNFIETGAVSVTGGGVCRLNGANVTLLDRITKFILFSGNVALAPNFETNGTIQNLQLDGAYLVGTNTVTGTLGIDGGGLGPGSPLTIAVGGTLDFNGAAVNIDAPLTNLGTVNWSGSTLFINNNNALYTGVIYNQPGALFKAQNDQSVVPGGYGFELFKNAGTVRKSTGIGATSFNVAFTNSGTIDAQSGTIRFNANGNLAGTYNTASGATIEFAAGNIMENGTVTITGSGVCRENGANITLINQIANFPLISGNVSLAPNFETDGAIHSLQLDGASLLGNNVVVGSLGINGGTIPSGAALTVTNGGTLNFNGGSVNINGPLTNSGTINWTGSGSLFVNNNNSALAGAIYNQPGALFNAFNDQSVVTGGYGFELFKNAGTLRKSAGLGATTLFIAFTNTGAIDAESGTIQFTGGGTLAGTYNTASGAMIQFSGGNFTEIGTPAITGSGLCRQNGANVTLANQITGLQLLAGNVALTPTFQSDGTIHSLQLDGALLVGTNVVTGILGMNGGGVQSGTALTIAASGTLNLNGATISISGPFTNAGTVNWTSPGCSIFVNNNNLNLTGAIYNQPGAVINIQNDQSVGTGGYGSESFRNDGTIRKTVSLGTTTIAVPFTETGTLDAQSGTIRFAGPYSASGGTMNFGITSLAAFGQIAFNANAPLGGTVSANLNAGYSPSIGDNFAVLSYGSRSGIFANAALPLPGQWQTNYGATTFTITVTNLTVVTPPVVLTPLSYSNGHFAMQITGPVGPAYLIQASSNLFNWIPLVTNTPSVVPFNVTDTNAGIFNPRFYRVYLLGP